MRVCRRRSLCCCLSPPLVLFAPAPVLLLAVPREVLGEAIAPLHRRWVAEPRGIGGVRARAAECSR